MSLDSYANLQTAIADHMGRPGDSIIAAVAPTLIALFEARFRRKMRVRQMETRDTAFSIAAQATALPAGFLQARALVLQTDPKVALQFVTPDQLWRTYPGSTTGQPRVYTIVGTEIIVGPAPDGTYTAELDYYAFSALSDSNTSNWLLTSYPDLYLFGALVEGLAYTKNSAAAAMWKARVAEGMAELAEDDSMARFPPGQLVARPSGGIA